MKTLLSLLLVTASAGLLASTVQPELELPSTVETYEVDAVHSFVVFHTKHLGIARAYGRFDRISREKSRVVLAPELGQSSILLVVDAASVSTGNAQRDAHLRNADFLDAEEHSEIVFESQKITGTAAAFDVEGELTFHGVTKPVQAKGNVVGSGDTPFGDHRTGFLAEFTVDLADFEVAMVEKNPGAVGPEVTITVSLECVRK